MYKKLLIALTLLSSKYIVHAEVHIAYQPYASDELVIDAGTYKMKAKDLVKYGIEAVRVTVTNRGTQEIIYSLDSKIMTPDEINKKLRYSKAMWFVKPFLAFGAISGLGGVTFAVTHYSTQELQQIGGVFRKHASEKRFSYQEFRQDPEIKELIDKIFLNIEVYIKGPDVIALLAGMGAQAVISGLAFYNFFISLPKFLQHELTPQELVVAPGTTVTKLIFIEKEAGSK